LKVGRQRLNHSSGQSPFHCEDGFSEMLRAPVGQVVPCHRGDHHMPKLQAAGRLRHALRLARIQRFRASGCHGAETARPGAAVAGDHERGRAALPTLPPVRTARAGAHGVDAQFLQKSGCLSEGGILGQPMAKPRRQAPSTRQRRPRRGMVHDKKPPQAESVSQKRASSRAPKSASTLLWTSITGAMDWPESRTISS